MSLPYTTIPMPETGTPEWHELRRTHGIGASEVAAVMGMSKWATPLDIYLLKRGTVPPSPSTRAMRRGNAMEPFILQEFIDETGLVVERPDCMAKSIAHPHLYVNPDGVVIGKDHPPTESVEIKSSDASKEFGESGSQDVPIQYYLQCQQSLLVTGHKVCWLAVMLPFSDLRIYPITPNKKLHAQIVEVTDRFWQNVLDGIPPESDASPEAVKKLYPSVDEGKVLELSSDKAITLVTRHKQVSDQIKALETEKDTVQAQLMMMVGDAKRAKIEGWNGSLTRSVSKDTPVSYIRKGSVTFKINHPKGDL